MARCCVILKFCADIHSSISFSMNRKPLKISTGEEREGGTVVEWRTSHRMTGTPWQNNTFELWSQFAFLNPGLLGKHDYFKHAFANPIESGGDEKAMALLKSLIYPFICAAPRNRLRPNYRRAPNAVVSIQTWNPRRKKLYTQTVKITALNCWAY